MSTLSQIVDVTITSSGRGISRAGFGTPLVIAQFPPSIFPERFKLYDTGTAVLDMIADGFTTNSPAVIAVQAVASNTPKPKSVIVGRLITEFDQELEILVRAVVAVGGEVYGMTIKAPDGTVTKVSYTALAADTDVDIAAALAPLINAITGVDGGLPTPGTLGVNGTAASTMAGVGDLDPALFVYTDNSGDSNLVAELTQIQALNSEWYGLILADPQSGERIGGLAGYIETQEKIFMATSKDTEILDVGGTDDIAFDLNAAQFFRTSLIYSGDVNQQAAATWMGNGFPFDPGSRTWAYKVLSGVAFDSLTASQQSALDAKKCNYYQSILGAPATNGGPSTGGTMASGEYIDVIRGRDWLVSRLRERIYQLLISVAKIPYTDGGIAMVTKEVDAQLREGIGAGYLSPDVPEGQDAPFVVTAPLASEVSSADKIARLLPNVAFEATLAGAIHATKINGSIAV